jgi:hypothetical protein
MHDLRVQRCRQSQLPEWPLIVHGERKLFAGGIEMSKLLEHTEVVAHCKVLDDFRFFQAEAMDMLDREFPAIRSQGWPM